MLQIEDLQIYEKGGSDHGDIIINLYLHALMQVLSCEFCEIFFEHLFL